MSKIEIEYILEKVNTATKSQILLSTFSLKEVASKIKELGLKSKAEHFKENQWFPYARVIAISPSGKIKYLKYKLENLQNCSCF